MTLPAPFPPWLRGERSIMRYRSRTGWRQRMAKESSTEI